MSAVDQPLSVCLDGPEFSLHLPSTSTAQHRTSPSVSNIIHPHEIVDLQHLGGGGYGRVMKCRWKTRQQLVAVKYFRAGPPNEKERGLKHRQSEVHQLLRVQHPNIVQLFGQSPPNSDETYIVIEYMSDGSLYDLMHNKVPRIEYTCGHAVSWLLQTARALHYLHTMRPPMIHRDLKSPNLLLSNSGRTLKLGDFGDAVDYDRSTFTNNKGTPVWMAPEVFESNKYSTKCDVYSLGIITWEVFSRLKPYSDLGKNELTICWNVYQGKRPPPMSSCPDRVQELMKRCWDKEQTSRPEVADIVAEFEQLIQLFPSATAALLVNVESNVEEVPMSSVNPVVSPVQRPDSMSFSRDADDGPSGDGTPTGQQQQQQGGSSSFLRVDCVETPLHSVCGSSSEALGMRRHSSGSDIRAALVRNAHSADPTHAQPPVPPRRERRSRRAGGSYETALIDLSTNSPSAAEPSRLTQNTNSLAFTPAFLNDIQERKSSDASEYAPQAPIAGNVESEDVYNRHAAAFGEYQALIAERGRIREEKQKLLGDLHRAEKYRDLYMEFVGQLYVFD